ncbi:protein kinase domain-containing protein [Alienimonas californiensis]|uniref:non-specific serine/threonine protein kinase n=1 Tax=Alienimonas californiensis TaxID=2527989 RepID=A0A517P4F9_9PLAN|nr:protein kinase [Alienimonas californiensis]QDT14278.1 Serine/threonine-protein kinase PknB [Alienimonas californiensis]
MPAPPPDVQSLFLQAAELDDPGERAALLDARCEGDAALRAEVEELLAAHGTPGGPLDRPAAARATAPSDRTAARHSTATVVNAPDTADPQPSAGATNDVAPGVPLNSAQKLGGYDVLETVGRGGMGVVLRARDPHLDRIVAIKALAPELAADPTARRRFAREARAAAAVTHPHVVTIHAVEPGGAGPEGPTPFLVMEYVAGRSLKDKLDADGALEVREALRIGSQVAAGLAAAHAQGLIHRDVKPGNVLLENGVERVKLTDFGLARAADDVAITRTGEIAGTPQFMSPEQAEGRPVDARSDLFSLGAVLYAMCTGRPPFRGESTLTVLRKVCDATPRPIREVNPDVPPWLTEIVDRLLEKDPGKRFASAAEVAALLGGRLAEMQNPDAAERPRPAAGLPSTARAGRGRRWTVAAAALAAVLLIGGTTEATGVTEVIPTVVRLVRGEGTLAIRTNDPDVGVTIEGEDVVLTGTGLSEIRLKPGTYQVKATKDGREFTELVTVERNGREVVNVGWEPAGREPAGREPAGRAGGQTGAFAGEPTAPPRRLGVVVGADPAAGTASIQLDEPAGLRPGAAFAVHPRADAGVPPSYIKAWVEAVRVPSDGRAEVRVLEYDAERPIAVGDWVSLWPPPGAGGSADGGTATAGDATFEPVASLRGHTDAVRDLAFFLDGRRLATGSADQTFRIWDAASGEELYRRDCPHWVSAVAVSPDGTQAALGYVTVTESAQIEIVDLETKERVHLLDGPPGLVHGLAYSPDGSRLLATGQQGVGLLFDPASGERLNEFRQGEDEVFGGEWAPDGRTFVTCSSRGPQIMTRDLNGAALHATVSLERAAVVDVRYSPDGTRLAAAITRPQIPIYDAADGTLIRLIETPGPTAEVRFLGDGRRLLAAGKDDALRLYDVESGRLLAERPLDGPHAAHLALAPDGALLATGGGRARNTLGGRPAPDPRDYDVRLWRLSGAETADANAADGSFALVRTFPGHASSVNAIAVYDEGRRAISGSEEHRFRVWNLETGALLKTIETGAAVKAVAVTADARFAIVGTANPAGVRWYDLEDGTLVRQAGDLGGAPNQFASALALTPDGSRVVASRLRGGPVVLDAATAELVRTLAPPPPMPKEGSDVGSLCLALSPDGMRAAAGWHSSGRDGEIVVWNLDDGAAVWSRDLGNRSTLDLAFSPDGARLLVGDSGGWLTLLDAGDGTTLRRFRGHGDAVNSVAVLPDGRRALTSGLDDVLTLWDLDSGEELARLARPDKTVLHVTPTPDGRGFLTGGGGYWDGEKSVRTGDYALRLWDFTDDRPRAADAVPPADDHAGRPPEPPSLVEDVRIEALSDFVLALAYTPDGRSLVTGGADGAFVWDARNGRRRRELTGHDGRSVHAAVVLPDGQRVVTAGKGDAILLSDLNSGEVVRRFEGHTGFVERLAVSPDGTRLASGSSNWVRKDRGDLTVRVWDVETGRELWQAEPPPTDNGYGAVHEVMFTPDGARVVSVHHAAEDGVSVWDAATGELLRRFSGKHSSIKSAALSPDGRTLATGHEAVQVKELRWDDPEHAVVRLWDLASGEEVRRLVGHAGQINAVAFSPDGTRLLSCSGSQYLNDAWTPELSRDNTLRLWDVATGAELARQRLPGGGQAAAYAPDGEHVASVAGGKNLLVQLWRIPDALAAESAAARNPAAAR